MSTNIPRIETQKLLQKVRWTIMFTVKFGDKFAESGLSTLFLPL
jgi:hypothetical protein